MKYLLVILVSALALVSPAWAQQATSTAPVHPGAANQNQIIITADEWKELRDARAAAIKAHPELLQENTELIEKIRAFEAKLNAAMIKANPSIAPLMVKYKANTTPPGDAPASTPTSMSK